MSNFKVMKLNVVLK